MPSKKTGGEGLKYIIVFGILFALGILLVWGMTGGFPWTRPEKPGVAEKGDMVRINYTGLYGNGSPFDSGILEFRPGTGQMRLKGIDEGVLGMRVGERRTLNLTPEHAFGEYDPGLVIEKPRVETRSSILTFDTTPEQFNATFGDFPVEGMIINSVDLPWRQVEVLNFTSTTMTWRLMPPEGLKMGWPAGCEGAGLAQLSSSCYGIAGIRTINDTHLEFAIEPFLGDKVNIGGAEARVTEADNESIYLDFNHEFAGQGFIYYIDLLALEKA